MIKKLALSGVLLTILILPSNAHANTYMAAASKAVNHIVGFHRDAGDIETNVVEKAKVKPAIKTQSIKTVEIKKTMVVMATAYSSTPDQTDDTPCITATGYDVCNKDRNIIAVSRDLVRSLGYGTQVRFPELFGDKIFHIEDTMNMRFTNRIDFHLDSREEAKTFGVKRDLKMEVI